MSLPTPLDTCQLEDCVKPAVSSAVIVMLTQSLLAWLHARSESRVWTYVIVLPASKDNDDEEEEEEEEGEDRWRRTLKRSARRIIDDPSPPNVRTTRKYANLSLSCTMTRVEG